MPLLFADSYKKIYQASPFALSTCLTFLLGVFVILMPIFAGYATDDFWDYLQVYYDQPIVGLNPDNFIIYVSKEDSFGTYFVPPTSSDFCVEQLDSLCQNRSLTTSPDPKGNNNIINKTDELSISFKVPSDSSNIKFMAFLDYGINSRIKFLMHTLLYLDIDINENIKTIETNGELILKQRAPFTSTTITNKQYYNNEYILDANKINPFDFVAIFDEFKNRNYTTEYKHSVWSRSKDTGTNSASQSDELEVNIKIRIPKAQKILYQQKTYDNLKKAWIQYIFIFIPIFLVVYYLLSFILTNQVFPCSMKSDLGRF